MKQKNKNSNGIAWLVITSIIFAYTLHGYLVGDLYLPSGGRFSHGPPVHLSGDAALRMTLIFGILVAVTPLLFLKDRHPESKWITPCFIILIVLDVFYFLSGVIGNHPI